MEMPRVNDYGNKDDYIADLLTYINHLHGKISGLQEFALKVFEKDLNDE